MKIDWGFFMDKEKIIFRARGPVYTHFALVILLFYVIFWDLKSGIVQVISGGVLIILGEFIRIWCASYIGTCGRAMSLDVKRLRVSGPYSFVRNPIYIGNFIWSAGLAVLANFPYVIPYFWACLIILYISIIPYEEKYLADTFGEEYKNYSSKVNRIIPVFGKKRNKEKSEYEIRLGLKNEIHVIIYLVISTAVFITLTAIRGGFAVK